MLVDSDVESKNVRDSEFEVVTEDVKVNVIDPTREKVVVKVTVRVPENESDSVNDSVVDTVFETVL